MTSLITAKGAQALTTRFQRGLKPLSKAELLSLLVISATMLTATGAHARGLPAQQGILNFGRVSERLYRGAQPDSSGLQSLKRLGVKMIVNLRMPGDGWKEEAAEAEANGIVYTNFPMHGTGRPDSEQVKQILALFENCSGPVFIHCRHGCDRTGTIVACYRIQHDGWSNDLAMREAKRYGISRFEFLMRRFVRNFRATVKADLRQAKAT